MPTSATRARSSRRMRVGCERTGVNHPDLLRRRHPPRRPAARRRGGRLAGNAPARRRRRGGLRPAGRPAPPARGRRGEVRGAVPAQLLDGDGRRLGARRHGAERQAALPARRHVPTDLQGVDLPQRDRRGRPLRLCSRLPSCVRPQDEVALRADAPSHVDAGHASRVAALLRGARPVR